MSGNGNYDDDPGGLPLHDCKTDGRDDGEEGRQRVMVVGISGRGTGGNRDLVDKGVHVAATGKNCGVCCR